MNYYSDTQIFNAEDFSHLINDDITPEMEAEATAQMKAEAEAVKLNSQNIDFELLERIASEAIAKLETSNRTDATRWINAIKKSVVELTTNPYWQFADGELLIKSDKSDKIYTANGTCFDSDGEPCKAFARNQPCFHRSAARILQRVAEQA